MPLTVGFDLDMTLIDPRPGMVRAFEVLAGETGIPLDGEAFAAHLGPPLESVFAGYGLDQPTIDALVARFREIYPEVVVPVTVALPGAAEALAAVRAAGGNTVVVTGKYALNAARHLGALGWEVDHLVGGLWSSGKGAALRQHGASVYVGDHVGDVRGAQAAGAVSVGVTTGPCTAEELAGAGADVVLADLTAFPDWLAGHLAGAGEDDLAAEAG
ncbi:phosphoglycolate phosphatase [Streptoalloteichus tenebrarius]|uniref:Phosphoglycolate phosphatase n=1 Tax=Streptoalloteichus tenebrarius (strain ATCC 17920 / DSM 40477 / JCM 4838 / CBS 697.72 / NBRC 16177 / NCIMB 11028 / NRRL B-12390 / A12253. 1 / ISP 5477) TaxID=1933 RepID=A0ABT1HVG2_STRSD|nr:haloacid dehalogenase-like hydrolase [Streptoalloteichus tenebrarius]MCP2259518.1 phosphoglycolate phosphatase [Streptoalloteichus tenebrarius]BFF01401.1 HAD family hydrolase [Streptoalloteichus tenebrarius]